MFVIDKSGSMGGSKWIKTVSVTIIALQKLQDGYDKFNIILFNNDVHIEKKPLKKSNKHHQK